MLGQGMKYETLETRKDGTKFLSRDMKRAATRLQQLATAYDFQAAEAGRRGLRSGRPFRLDLRRPLRALGRMLSVALFLKLCPEVAI